MAAISRSIGLVLLLWTMSCAAQDQALNVLVGDLTFIRPEGWRWEKPANNSVAESRFIVPGPDGKVAGDCRFYLTKTDWEKTKTLWKTQFSRRGQPTRIDEEPVKTSAGKLLFYSLDGDYAITEKNALQRNSRLVGTLIKSGDQFVRVRIAGPRADVEKATPAFKKMVIDAFEQRGAEK